MPHAMAAHKVLPALITAIGHSKGAEGTDKLLRACLLIGTILTEGEYRELLLPRVKQWAVSRTGHASQTAVHWAHCVCT